MKWATRMGAPSPADSRTGRPMITLRPGPRNRGLPGTPNRMLTLSKLANCVQPSATLAAGAKARQLRSSGVTVYDFSLGEPDQPTPEHICRAAAEAMRAGHTHYTPVAGIPEARAAVARWYERFHGYKVIPEQVVLSNGAKHSIHNTLVTTCGAGDEVVIPTPYWVSYSELVCMAGATPVLVNTSFESEFKVTS